MSARPRPHPVTVVFDHRVYEGHGVWNRKYKRLEWRVPAGYEARPADHQAFTIREPYGRFVETPGWAEGIMWAWGHGTPAARALLAAAALEATA